MQCLCSYFPTISTYYSSLVTTSTPLQKKHTSSWTNTSVDYRQYPRTTNKITPKKDPNNIQTLDELGPWVEAQTTLPRRPQYSFCLHEGVVIAKGFLVSRLSTDFPHHIYSFYKRLQILSRHLLPLLKLLLALWSLSDHVESQSTNISCACPTIPPRL